MAPEPTSNGHKANPTNHEPAQTAIFWFIPLPSCLYTFAFIWSLLVFGPAVEVLFLPTAKKNALFWIYYDRFLVCF